MIHADGRREWNDHNVHELCHKRKLNTKGASSHGNEQQTWSPPPQWKDPLKGLSKGPKNTSSHHPRLKTIEARCWQFVQCQPEVPLPRAGTQWESRRPEHWAAGASRPPARKGAGLAQAKYMTLRVSGWIVTARASATTVRSSPLLDWWLPSPLSCSFSTRWYRARKATRCA